MNGEMISDALGCLDDELVAQTDEVRRGKRVLWRSAPVRGIIAAAACAVLVLVGVMVLPPLTASDSGENGMDYMEDYAAEGADEPHYAASSTSLQWKTVTLSGITVSMPQDWEVMDVNGEDVSYVSLFHGENYLIIEHDPNFAVCGTGLEYRDLTIAGMEARAGFYDGSPMWSFIKLEDDCVVRNESGEDWSEEELDEIIKILESIVHHPHAENEGSGTGQTHHNESGGHHSDNHH